MARKSTATRFRKYPSPPVRRGSPPRARPESDNDSEEDHEDHDDTNTEVKEEEQQQQQEARVDGGDNQDDPQPALAVSQNPVAQAQQHAVPAPPAAPPAAVVENMQPRLAALETRIFGQTSAQLDMRSRLVTMEQWTMGTEMPGSALQRIEQLEIFAGIRET